MAAGYAIKRDLERIAKGTHFFCKGHLTAMPKVKQSENAGYCVRCYNRIKDLLPGSVLE